MALASGLVPGSAPEATPGVAVGAAPDAALDAAPDAAPEAAPEAALGTTPGAAPADIAVLLDRARALGLAGERAWRRLLHYHDTLGGPGPPVSHVDDARFFLAGPAGRHDAAAELDATIAALFGTVGRHSGRPPGNGTGDDPRCRFVARERWLRERLDADPGVEAARALPPRRAPCADHVAWRETVNADSVTLIFPAAYLNNPSSMFGHTLLRLDPPDVASGSDWLSWSLNFSADVGDDTPQSAVYAWKGITGGYPGRFLLEPYFTKLRQYGAIENRDIREYRLDLTPAEVTRLVEHVWELRDLAFDYYFFRENCSFRLLELLEHARPSLDLVSGFRFTAIPADTVRAVVEAGLVTSSTWLPSSASLLAHESTTVAADARPWIDALARDPARASEPGFATRDVATRRDIVRAANRLMTYRARREPPSEAASARRLAMLSLLASYPPAPSPSPLPPSPPERGHDTTLVTLGIGREGGRDGGRDDGREGGRGHVEFGFRASYHDLLDRPQGYLPGAAISLGELRLRADDKEGLRLQGFELVSIRSVGVPVPFLPAVAWGVDAGFVRDVDVEGGRLGFRAGGLAGLSGSPGEGTGLLLHALVGPSARLFARADERPGRARLDAVLRIGALFHGRAGGTLLELGADSPQGRSPRLSLELAHDLPFGRNRALRARATLSRLDGERRRRVSLDYRVHF